MVTRASGWTLLEIVPIHCTRAMQIDTQAFEAQLNSDSYPTAALESAKIPIHGLRLVVVSNRLPFTVSVRGGTPDFAVSSGGLTSGLWSYLENALQPRDRRIFSGWVGPEPWPPLISKPSSVSTPKTFQSRAGFPLKPKAWNGFIWGSATGRSGRCSTISDSLVQYDEEDWEQYGNESGFRGGARWRCFDPTTWSGCMITS